MICWYISSRRDGKWKKTGWVYQAGKMLADVFTVKMEADRSALSWTFTIWFVNSDGFRLRNKFSNLESDVLQSFILETARFQTRQAQQRNTASVCRWLSELSHFFQVRQQPGMVQKPSPSTHLSKNSLSLCFIHPGSFPIFTISKEVMKRLFSWELHLGMLQYLKTI